MEKHKIKRLGNGHYQMTYRGFTIDVSRVGYNNWYAEVDCGGNWLFQDELDASTDSKTSVIELVQYHIDLHLDKVIA
jgi:hypothetical protein